MKFIFTIFILTLCIINITHENHHHADVPKDNIIFEVISEHDGPLIGPKYSVTVGNKSGFETGCLIIS